MANYFSDERAKPASGFVEHMIERDGAGAGLLFILLKNLLFWGSIAASTGILFLLI